MSARVRAARQFGCLRDEDICRWIEQRDVDKVWAVLLGTLGGPHYEVIRAAFAGYLQIGENDISYQRLQMIAVTHPAQRLDYLVLPPVLVNYQRTVLMRNLGTGDEYMGLVSAAYLAQLKDALLVVQNARNQALAVPPPVLVAPDFGTTTEAEFDRIATSLMYLSADGTFLQVQTYVDSYDKALKAATKDAEKDLKAADKKIEHTDFQMKVDAAVLEFGFPFYTEQLANAVQFGIILRDVKQNALSDDPKAHPNRMKPMTDRVGSVLAYEDDEELTVAEKKSSSKLIEGTRMYLLSVMVAKGDLGWFGPLPTLAFLDMLQQLLASPYVTVELAYEERDLALKNIREKIRGYPVAPAVSVNTAMLDECKEIKKRLETVYPRIHNRSASDVEIVDKDKTKVWKDENAKLKQENNELKKELNTAQNTISSMRGDSRGRGGSRSREWARRRDHQSHSRERNRERQVRFDSGESANVSGRDRDGSRDRDRDGRRERSRDRDRGRRR